MNTTVMRCVLAALGLMTGMPAVAVHVDPEGRGQVLIYPYYTVNGQQQTLLSVTNTASVAQAAKVLVREGYNGRKVLDFNVYLAPFDSWSGTIFALRDAGIASDGAAILTRDRSCTWPSFTSDGTSIGSMAYLAFRDAGYLVPDDGGPYTIDRTREGWVEIIALGDLAAPWSGYIAHGITGSPPTGCAQVAAIANGAAGVSAPSGGLIGSMGVINGYQGTYLTSRAEALADFTSVPLFPGAGDDVSLASVNDGTTPELLARATATVFDAQGRSHDLTYPGSDPRSRKIDAVSAVLMADVLDNEYQVSPVLAAASDWVVTMPTKAFYVDRLHVGADSAVPPFWHVYDRYGYGSPVPLSFRIYDNNGWLRGQTPSGCGWVCPGGTYPPTLRRSTDVIPITDRYFTESGVLRSQLMAWLQGVGYLFTFNGISGSMRVSLDSYHPGHRLLPSAEGKILHGLPVIGFWAVNMINNHVSNGVLANYAAAVPHVKSVTCVNDRDGAPCE